MNKIRPFLPLAALLALGLQPAPAQAQFSRTYVSAVNGHDANNCGFGAPCRSFQRAHDQTNDQGEITVLDAAEYGIVTITKSISIVNDGGGEASIQVKFNFAGITINGGPGTYVNLRGITIQGVGPGTGLQFNSGFSLTMENCVVRNLTHGGIAFMPSGGGRLAVSNTLVADNGSDGIFIGGSGTVLAVLNRVEAYNNSGDGFHVFPAGGTVNATVADSVAANNSLAGFRAETGISGSATVMLVRSVASDNQLIGLFASGGTATLRVGQTVVTGNQRSWTLDSGAALKSYGDNKIDGNGDGDPAPATIGKK
jgi:hypothetical protein